jgi:uncharacterized protein (TIGR02246 family)
MSIFKQQADGTWKLYRDMTHSNIPPTPPTDVNEVAAAIRAVWDEYEASILAGDPDRWIQLWEDDGVQLPPGVPPVVGKETIYSRISDDLATFDYSEFVITNEDVEVNGDLAFARGNYVVTFAPKAGGETMDLNGKYMTIFHQQPDGSWKIYRDIFNSSGSPDEAAAVASEDAAAAAIDAFWRDYERTMLAGDATHCGELWTEAGAQLPPDVSADVVESVSFPSMASDPSQLDYSQFVINNESLDVHGDWAVARGTYMAQCTPKGIGDFIELEGDYLTIFVQGPDGSWQLYQDPLN